MIHIPGKTIGTLFKAIIVAILFSSCQKEITGDIGPSTTNPSGTSNKVKTYTEDYTAGTVQQKLTFELQYDASDRVVNINSTTNTGDKFVFKYNTDNTYTMDLYNSNVLSIHEKFFLNNLPMVDSTIQYEQGGDTSTEKYLYNSSRQLVTLKSYHYSQLTGSTLLNTTTYTYDNTGNLAKETDLHSTTTYEYYNDRPNNISTGFLYLRQDKNLIKTTTYTVGTSSQTTNHTYTFDTNQRVTTEKAVGNNGEVLIKTFTYY